MKKVIALLCVCAAISAVIGAVPGAVESSVPSAHTTYAHTAYYREAVSGSGSLSYIDQSDITSTLPLVIKKFCVSPGDTVEFGDTVAIVDRDASASLIESLGQVTQLAVAAANLSTAVSLIPEEISADRSGRVISTAGNGAAVESGYSIATIAGTDTMVVTAAVSELDIAEIKLGQKAEFTCAAYPDEVFSGTVAAIADAARSKYSGAVLETVVDVIVAPDDPDERLKSGLSAEVNFFLSDMRSICVLAYEAIGQDDSGEYVYIYEDGQALRRDILTGAEFSDGTEIVRGITTEDRVFLNPEKISKNSYITLAEEQ